jgi:Flp pilus assembly protein TadD
MRGYLFAFAALISAGLVQAEADLETAFETGLERADGLAREGQVDSALAAYRALSDRQPDSAVVRTRAGGMLLLKRQYAEAVRSFQVAIGLDPENSGEAFVGLGIAYLHLGQYGPARAALTEARRLKPGSAADLDQLVAWLDGRASARADSQR